MTFSSWMLSIAGVVFLGVLVDLILPEGQTNKYLKSIFAFFIIFTIISPLPTLLKSDFELSDFLETEEVSIDTNFIASVNTAKIVAIKEGITKKLEENGYSHIYISVTADIYDENMQIEKIYADLSDLVIDTKIANINSNTKEVILKLIVDYTGIEKENVTVYGY